MPPGYYRVKAGDTLSQIARQHRRSVLDIVRWSKLSNPDVIEAGQMLRITPPGNTPQANTNETALPANNNRRGARQQTTPPAKTVAKSARAFPGSLIWPAQGEITRSFDGVKSKGIDIANAPGTPIVAAAAGTVVYAGNGLRGYGNLLIIKHRGTFLTAYAHNRVLLAKEGQTITQGQKIAEMGDTDNNHRVALHFELRDNGRSIDPKQYLPSR